MIICVGICDLKNSLSEVPISLLGLCAFSFAGLSACICESRGTIVYFRFIIYTDLRNELTQFPSDVSSSRSFGQGELTSVIPIGAVKPISEPARVCPTSFSRELR